MEVGKTFSVPDERLSPKVVEWTRRIHDRFGTAEVDSVVVAQALGHASVGGAFNSKVALMTSYGVVERGQGKIRVSDIGRMIVSPRTSKDVVEGVRASLLSVSLWQRLYRDYKPRGLKIPPDFAPELAKISGTTITEARNKAEWVARAFAEDFGYLESVEREAKSPEAMANRAQRVELLPAQAATGIGPAEVHPATATDDQSDQIVFLSQRDHIQISVPRSSKHIGMLRTFVDSALRAIEDDLASKPDSAKEKPRKQAEK